MSINPTNEHREQAREIDSVWPERIWIDKDGLRHFRSRGVMSCYPNRYAPSPEISMDYVRAAALSSRDAEVREVLSGFIHAGVEFDDDRLGHVVVQIDRRDLEKARELYAKLQPLQSENPGDTLRE